MKAGTRTQRPALRLGDTVGYSAAWLRGPGGYSHILGARRGTVADLCTVGGALFVRVLWHDCDELRLVAASNLARPGTVAFSD